MIYYHIGDKKALYTRVLHEIFGDVAARMADNINRAVSPIDKVRAYINSIRQTLGKHPHLPTIMMHELASGGRHLPEIVAYDLASIIGLISDVVAQGHKKGDFNNIDPFVLHLMVIGGVSYFKTSGPLRHRHATLTGDETDSIVDDSNDALLSRIEAIVVSALKK
jgi:AcrR family transcriptional regulator